MTPRTILVADEDFDTRVILRAILQRSGYVVVEAANCDEAVLAAQTQTFDMFIVNYPMFNLRGETIAQSLRNATPSLHVPLVNLTSRVVPHFLERAAKEGVDFTVGKPIDAKQVLEIVQRFTSPTMQLF